MSKVNLVNISDLIPDAIIDLRYAGVHNITGVVLYSENKAMIDEVVAIALSKVADLLRTKRLRLVIWDAYRPLKVQEKLRAISTDDRYVAKNSNHTKGRAVDVSLADQGGKYLDMGTSYDVFSLKAHSDFKDLSDLQILNRQVLGSSMISAGFKQWPYEWWHFDFNQH